MVFIAAAAFGCSSTSSSPSPSPSSDSTPPLGQTNLLSPSTLTGQPTLAASFTLAEDGDYEIDFGDGGTKKFSATGCPESASCKLSHDYDAAGVYHVSLTSAGAVAGWCEVAVGGTQIAPTLTAISPAHGPVGSTIQLSGSGFIGLDGSLVIDGVPGFPNTTEFSDLVPTSDSLLSFDFPTDATEPCTCPAGSTCECASRSFQPGPHSISIKNEEGTSNTVTFTVDP